MGEVVNLRSVRKAKVKAAADTAAAANRAKFGRTKGEKQRDAIEAARRARSIEGAKLDD